MYSRKVSPLFFIILVRHQQHINSMLLNSRHGTISTPGESENELHTNESYGARNSTAGDLPSVLDSVATLPDEIMELDKIGFDDILEVDKSEILLYKKDAH